MLVMVQRRLMSTNLKGSSKKWMDRHVNDQFVKQAKLQSYRSRAAFKLMEINQKFFILRPGMKVIDVGAAPGGWSQVIADKVESKIGKESVVAVDLLQMESVDGVKFVQGNIEEDAIQEKISEMLDFQKADLVCSDAVPDFVGERFVDHMGAVQLNYQVIKFCQKNLRKGGNLLMKIIQGPAEKGLYDDAKLYFEKLQRVKPSASRQESAEIYFLGQGYEQSQEQLSLDLQKEKKKIESLKTPEEQMEYADALMKEGKDFLQELVTLALKSGKELPEDLKERFKQGQLGREINIEQKMSIREKQKARQKTEEDEEKAFFEATGIRDKSKDFTMDNLIKKYENDMDRYERKMEKMKKYEAEGIQYDINDIHLTDDEKDYLDKVGEERLKKEPQYDDEYTKVAEDEKLNYEKQYENIEQKLKDLGDKADHTHINKESDYYKQYEQILEDVEKFQDSYLRDNERLQDEQLIKDELKEFGKKYDQEKSQKDEYFQKRDQKEKLKKTGGAKSDSPIWNDDE